MPSFSTLVTMPIPHFNTLSMVGMETKHEYLIWRKSINGFFTALDKHGDMYTWSYSNGKMLYKNSLNNQQLDDNKVKSTKENLKNYSVYRSDENDNVYTQDLYEQEQSTYQLLVSN